MKRLISYFSMFSVKMFLGFWIIAICAIFATRWVSVKFTEMEEVRPIPRGAMHHLKKVNDRLIQTGERHGDKIWRLIDNRDKRVPKEIWLKSVDSHRIASNARKQKAEIKEYILNSQFDHPVVRVFGNSQLLGPIDLEFNDQPYQLFVSRPLHGKDFVGRIHAIPFWLRIVTTLLVTGLLSWLLARLFMRPMNVLKQASEKFGEGELNTRIPQFDQRIDEFGQLGQAFNTMAERIQESVSSQQRLLGDISHELRSPLTRLQLALSLANRVDDRSDEMQRYLQRCETEVARLDDMISQALQLSRLENQLVHMSSEPVNIGNLCGKLVNDYELVLAEKQLQLHSDIAQNLIIEGDAAMLSSAIENLLSNAIRYSPEQAQIQLSCQVNDGFIHIVITDQGQGVEVSQLQQIFKPFYRTSEARDRISGGTGLGLAIASRAIAAHGGDIYAQLASKNKTNPGLQVTIKLPYDATLNS
ncbi:HAMP domain-containing protein [Thalassotalea sp. HSM 43]|uniref:ATP-binding protein n=1 Tax=Thalassotalea sp. HSM 43 TaxID=2552945 RepID=UPI001080D9E2|nr:ATP-binding protein [Thalassotalea sp. HSM 43]QBY04619.1 HAMP domain-containing protein [Thalassotalea sp. HSM 43]